MTRRPPYQDVWRDGQLIRKGRRECAERFAAIAGRIGRTPESLADIGGWDGYFARRFHEAGCERVTLVEPRNVANLPDGVTHIQGHVDETTVNGLQPHDVVLALAVLHHIEAWEGVYAELRRRCRLLVVEVAHPAEVAVGARLSPTLRDTEHRIGPVHERLTTDGDVFATTPGPNGPTRPLVAVDNLWSGRVTSGRGVAHDLMANVDPGAWAPLGYAPAPGTLNLEVGMAGKRWVRHLPGGVGIDSGAPLGDTYWPVTIAGVPGHLRLSRARTVVEAVAPVSLRRVCALSDGDTVEIRPR